MDKNTWFETISIYDNQKDQIFDAVADRFIQEVRDMLVNYPCPVALVNCDQIGVRVGITDDEMFRKFFIGPDFWIGYKGGYHIEDYPDDFYKYPSKEIIMDVKDNPNNIEFFNALMRKGFEIYFDRTDKEWFVFAKM